MGTYRHRSISLFPSTAGDAWRGWSQRSARLRQGVLGSLAALALLLLLAAVTLAAGPIARTTVVFDEPFSEEAISTPEEAACIGWSGGISGWIKGTFTVAEFVDGPNAGDLHVGGSATITFAFVDSEGVAVGGATVRNTIRETIVAGTSRASVFVGQLAGTRPDGSPVRLQMHANLVRTPGGEVIVDSFKVTCAR